MYASKIRGKFHGIKRKGSKRMKDKILLINSVVVLVNTVFVFFRFPLILSICTCYSLDSISSRKISENLKVLLQVVSSSWWLWSPIHLFFLHYVLPGIRIDSQMRSWPVLSWSVPNLRSYSFNDINDFGFWNQFWLVILSPSRISMHMLSR